MWHFTFEILTVTALLFLVLFCLRFSCSNRPAPRQPGGRTDLRKGLPSSRTCRSLLWHVRPVCHCGLCYQTRTGEYSARPLTYNLGYYCFFRVSSGLHDICHIRKLDDRETIYSWPVNRSLVLTGTFYT